MKNKINELEHALSKIYQKAYRRIQAVSSQASMTGFSESTVYILVKKYAAMGAALRPI